MATQTLHPSSAFHPWRIERPITPLRGSYESGFHKNGGHHLEDSDKTSPEGRSIHDSNAAIKRLPAEILDQIMGYLATEIPPLPYEPRNADLMSCLLASSNLHAAALRALYQNVTILHSRSYSNMLRHITDHPHLGKLVKRLDLSQYTVIGLGRSRKANTEIRNLSPETLVLALSLTSNLREFLVHEHVDDELDEAVLRKLFSMPKIEAIDLCACSSQMFVKGFEAAMNTNTMLAPLLPNLKRLSLHECSTLQAPVFEALLPRLTNLTHLDVSHTLITNKALHSIPDTARLTHLNLSKCTRLTGSSVVKFIVDHPSTKALQYLNLMSVPSRHVLLSSMDVDKLLPALPTTLRSLNINGPWLCSAQLPLILPLTKHLHELSIAHSTLSMYDINSLFRPPRSPYLSASASDEIAADWEPCTLRYIDLTSVVSISRATLFAPSTLLFTSATLPLDTIELSDETLISPLRGRYSTPGNGLGWIIKESGRRSYLIRDHSTLISTDDGAMCVEDDQELIDSKDDNDREEEDMSWKMGLKNKYWGMRKIPVSEITGGSVGGMYGHYMFKS